MLMSKCEENYSLCCDATILDGMLVICGAADWVRPDSQFQYYLLATLWSSNFLSPSIIKFCLGI